MRRQVHAVDAQMGGMRRAIECISITEDDKHAYCGTRTGDVLKFKIDRDDIRVRSVRACVWLFFLVSIDRSNRLVNEKMSLSVRLNTRNASKDHDLGPREGVCVFQGLQQTALTGWLLNVCLVRTE